MLLLGRACLARTLFCAILRELFYFWIIFWSECCFLTNYPAVVDAAAVIDNAWGSQFYLSSGSDIWFLPCVAFLFYFFPQPAFLMVGDLRNRVLLTSVWDIILASSASWFALHVFWYDSQIMYFVILSRLLHFATEIEIFFARCILQGHL